jgi:hypothetical protein
MKLLLAAQQWLYGVWNSLVPPFALINATQLLAAAEKSRESDGGLSLQLYTFGLEMYGQWIPMIQILLILFQIPLAGL